MELSDSEKLTTIPLDVDFTNVKPLSNFEVYDFIKNRTGSNDKLRCQQTLFFTALKFFNEKSPCTCQTPEAIQKFINEMKPFNLNKSELLALINNCPITQVELSIVRSGTFSIYLVRNLQIFNYFALFLDDK